MRNDERKGEMRDELGGWQQKRNDRKDQKYTRKNIAVG